ncbi:MAG: hypothetical protein OXF52_00880 [Candidatus Dadabacteria bacterium]|nr:hypothetical protein [Candidatus Dadabacteria bacterium]
MRLSKKTLEKLRLLINEETEYRSGPNLVRFFNDLGFSDSYSQGFPSRWIYTDSKLESINGTAHLDKCIKNLFAPINFLDNFSKLDSHIEDFNRYLAFDKWKVIRKNAVITFKRVDQILIDSTSEKDEENEFLKREFTNIKIETLPIEGAVKDILQYRIKEIGKCLNAGGSLATILLAGSTLEGLLFGLAIVYPKQFNKSKSAPKDERNEVKELRRWSLVDFLNVAKDLGLIKRDTFEFSNSLRYFRNYIHPFQQMSSGFTPTERTAKICLQVLKAAIDDLNNSVSTL